MQLRSQTAFSATLTRVSTLLRSAFRMLNREGGDGGPDAADLSLERECELSQLERENTVLRMLLGIPGAEEETHMRLALPPSEDGRGSAMSAVSRNAGETSSTWRFTTAVMSYFDAATFMSTSISRVVTSGSGTG